MRRRSRTVSLETEFWTDVREGKRMCSTRSCPRHSSGSGRQWCVLSYLDVRLTSCACHACEYPSAAEAFTWYSQTEEQLA